MDLVISKCVDGLGIDIPIYTLEYMMPILQSEGIVEYDSIIRIYKVNKSKETEGQLFYIDNKIIEIEKTLNEYVNTNDLSGALFSKSWSDALISFLKPSSEPANKPKKIKSVIVSDSLEVERYVIADFIRFCHENDSDSYSAILDIFVGVLIEDFIYSLTSFGNADSFPKMTAYYDTAILLRILGTSGDLLYKATAELHRYIGDLEIKTEFFQVNEDETANILSAIVAQGNVGSNIFGETGDAITRGEVSLGQIRTLEHIFVERLAANNIFPAGYERSGFQKNVRNQIDERKFAEGLVAQAKLKDRTYSHENAEHDAISLGHVFRMRLGRPVRDLAECPSIFVTSNRLLASFARRFLINERQMGHNEIPPVFHVSQACTIFWLAKDREIDEARASQQLLANCYDALRPDNDFYQELFSKLNSYDGYDDNDAAVITTVRRIAKREAFGRTAILHVLSPAEILARANEEVARKATEHETEKERIREDAKASGIESGIQDYREKGLNRSNEISDAIVTTIEVLMFLTVSVFAVDGIVRNGYGGAYGIVLVGVAVLVMILTLMDYFRFWHFRALTDPVRRWLKQKIFNTFYR
ncbi:MAG: hypothetical protein M9905_00550 [Rhizobiaceae bacterium]|nr:hypothetical protein [Rhizobiaceae bacterium]